MNWNEKKYFFSAHCTPVTGCSIRGLQAKHPPCTSAHCYSTTSGHLPALLHQHKPEAAPLHHQLRAAWNHTNPIQPNDCLHPQRSQLLQRNSTQPAQGMIKFPQWSCVRKGLISPERRCQLSKINREEKSMEKEQHLQRTIHHILKLVSAALSEVSVSPLTAERS